MTHPPPGGPSWLEEQAPGAGEGDRPAWLRQPAPPPPAPRRGRRVGGLTAVLVLLLVAGLAAAGLAFATRREPPAETAGGTERAAR